MLVNLRYPHLYRKRRKYRQNRTHWTTNWGNITPLNHNPTNSRTYYVVSTTRAVMLPKRFLNFIRRYFKKRLGRFTKGFKFKVSLNTTLSKKQKNSRMGKGVGMLVRYGYIIKPHYPFIVCRRYHSHRLKKFIQFLNKRLPNPLFIYSYKPTKTNRKGLSNLFN